MAFLYKSHKVYDPKRECYCNYAAYCNDCHTKLLPEHISTGLALISRYRVKLSVNGLGKIVEPLYISLGNCIHFLHSILFVRYDVSAISVLNKLRKNLASSGSESQLHQSVNIGRDAVMLYAKTRGASLIKLNIGFKK